jgi:hypothetical protein
LTDFYDSVTGKTYCWINNHIYEHPNSPLGNVTSFPYATPPNTEPAFKTFIQLAGTKEDFLQFAHEYGPLNTIKPEYTKQDKIKQSFNYWQEMHQQMIEVHTIFQAIKKGDNKVIISLLAVEEIVGNEIKPIPLDDKGNLSLIDAIRRLKQNNNMNTLLINQKSSISHSNLINYTKDILSLCDLAKLYISNIIQHATKSLSHTYALQYNLPQGKWLPINTPKSLVAFLWYQLEEEIAGKRKYKKCEHCNKWEDLTSEKGQKRRRYAQWSEHPKCGSKDRMQNMRDLTKPKKRGRPKKK